METDEEDSVKMLMDMGFPDEDEVRAALRMAKNDISEAVVFLTDENFKSNMYPSSSRALALPGPTNFVDSDKTEDQQMSTGEVGMWLPGGCYDWVMAIGVCLLLPPPHTMRFSSVAL